jgi:hypothetical protein
MSKAAAFSDPDAEYENQAKSYLVEIRRVLKELSSERLREEKRRKFLEEQSITAEVKAILHGT